ELPALLEQLPTYVHEGAVFVRSTDFGDDKDRVLIRSAEKGGLPTYEAADIAYLRDKLERGFDRAIYVLGADHHGVAGWLPVYAIKVADDFHRFYHDVRVLGSEAEERRLGLCRATQQVIARCLHLVGVDAPERM